MINFRDDLQYAKKRLDALREIVKEYERHYDALYSLALKSGEVGSNQQRAKAGTPTRTDKATDSGSDNQQFLLSFVYRHPEHGVTQQEIKLAFADEGRVIGKNYVTNTVNRLAAGSNPRLRIEGGRNGRVFPLNATGREPKDISVSEVAEDTGLPYSVDDNNFEEIHLA